MGNCSCSYIFLLLSIITDNKSIQRISPCLVIGIFCGGASFNSTSLVAHIYCQYTEYLGWIPSLYCGKYENYRRSLLQILITIIDTIFSSYSQKLIPTQYNVIPTKTLSISNTGTTSRLLWRQALWFISRRINMGCISIKMASYKT